MRIAAAQIAGTRLADWERTLAELEELPQQAADAGANLLVMPECAWPAYVLGSPELYWEARGNGMPNSEQVVERFARLARKTGVALCLGFVEERGDQLCNAACFIDRDGHNCGVHRKCFLWDFDRCCFQPGSAIQPFDTSFGCVGVLICADARLPEVAATLVTRGAELLLQPTGWVNAGSPDDLWNPQPDFLIAARAREFGVPIASASKWGMEGETTFVGSSLICDRDGTVRAQCGQVGSDIIATDVSAGPVGRLPLHPPDRAALLSVKPPTVTQAVDGKLELLVCDSGTPFNTQTDANSRLRVELAEAQAPAVEHIASELVVRGVPDTPVHHLGPLRIAVVAGADAARFGKLRRAALEGVHLAVVIGDRVREPAVRTRACENRIFVLWVRANRATLVGPGGRIIRDVERLPGPGHPWLVEHILPAEAARKEVAWKTDMIKGRTPQLYEF